MSRRPVRETVPTDTEVTDEDWYAREIAGESFSGVAFVDVDMTEVTTTSSVFDGCTFRGVRFNASSHTDSAFLNCTFRSCTFFDTTIIRCKVVGSTPRRAAVRRWWPPEAVRASRISARSYDSRSAFSLAASR